MRSKSLFGIEYIDENGERVRVDGPYEKIVKEDGFYTVKDIKNVVKQALENDPLECSICGDFICNYIQDEVGDMPDLITAVCQKCKTKYS